MDISYTPIGFFKCQQHKPYEAPRQGSLQGGEGRVELISSIPSLCLDSLAGFERLWLIYDFHKNKSWRPKVRPPQDPQVKRGVYATRSPYRPNSIGLSCVRLVHIDDHIIIVDESDLLDGTPVLDIKPYLPFADSFPQAQTGWVKPKKKFEIEISSLAQKKLDWLEKEFQVEIERVLNIQLSYEPTNGQAKRVKAHGDQFVFSYQAWRIVFSVAENTIRIENCLSGYSDEELRSNSLDRQQKKTHLAFRHNFNC